MSWELIGCSRHQVESYPLKRVGLSSLIDGGDDDIGLCDAIYSDLAGTSGGELSVEESGIVDIDDGGDDDIGLCDALFWQAAHIHRNAFIMKRLRMW
eukprot:CAMPEP_0201739812 /NCGR_PEP_ID=MMETSP0593-20130828/45980_1 /ASSEMBLY_ACC=CAM_ASM_000672 /TAXON_ID=267983 /ORGANISM="Skeletonema japonicum, Strain CCMP2506" /LENGTH=96 /DNA_ID=CAMNT_0048234105 /DNA_START=178 /DNA_END=466 /DNA_ORIENTATION=-